ncbi:MAG: alpha/beta hydrolase [Fibrobacter sp.]|nr:alpha/beta hydrolase [Fibrobacter sp.]
MKSKFLKMAVVVAAALALVNCGDESNPANPDQNPIGELSSSSDVTGTPDVGVSSSSEIAGPIAGISSSSEIAGPVAGVSSSSEIAGPVAGVSSSSEKPVAASSSSVAAPKSSSSEKVVPSSSSAAPKGIFLATDTDENKDYMEVVYQTNTGDNGGGVLAYPKRLSETQKHGVVLWGPGGGSKPTEYEGIIKRLASHGFVVIATSESPNGTERGIPALNWLDKKNNTPGDPLYQKLDMNVVGASGHSMGGLQSEQMLINDKRVKTAIMNNSGAWDGKAAALVPTGQGKTIALVYGEVGSESDNAKNDYNNPGVKVPACLLRMENNNYGHGSGPWDGQAATVAWMRWHLGGEDFRKADFVGSTGKYINGPVYTWQGAKGNWKGQCKNF